MTVMFLFFVSCTEDIGIISQNYNTENLTCFSSSIPEHTRTTLDNTGKFRWSNDDVIYVKDDNGVWQKSVEMRITDNDNMTATFYMPGKYAHDNYSVIYSKNGATPNEILPVTIASEQIQSVPNNSEHLVTSGDCAVSEGSAKAHKENGKFKFVLTHQFSYILIEPRISGDPNDGKRYTLNRIWLTEVSKNRKDICGVITVNEDGAVIGDASFNGDSTITVICGKDVKPVESGEISIDHATNYGFPFTNYDNDCYKGNAYDGKPVARVFVLVKPGTYNFRIDYEVSTESAYEQRAFHTIRKKFKNILSDEEVTVTGTNEVSIYENDGDWELIADESYWTPVPRSFTDTISKYVNNMKLEKNHFYRLRNQLNVVDPGPYVEYDYTFKGYYMWGAIKWFWDAEYVGDYDYPVVYDGIGDVTKAPQETAEDDRWYGSATYNVRPGGMSGQKHAQASKEPWSKSTTSNNTSKSISANQMSYYVIYGDPHYDNTTPWKLEYYRGHNGYNESTIPIVCYGGVWLKKKEYIVSDNGITWPADNDQSTSGNLSAPWEGGSKYNLRYNAPWNNFRTNYTNLPKYEESGKWLKPWELDTNKEESHYFFVPCLGQIMYNHPNHPGEPVLSLVGTQGFYWTNTPVRENEGNTKWSVNGGNGYDNAYYFNIHYNYVALSWQQRGIHVKNGMRIATKGYDGYTGMFK